MANYLHNFIRGLLQDLQGYFAESKSSNSNAQSSPRSLSTISCQDSTVTHGVTSIVQQAMIEKGSPKRKRQKREECVPRERSTFLSEESNSSIAIHYDDVLSSPKDSCSVNFPFCGRCAARGLKIEATYFGHCKSCPKSAGGNTISIGKSVFCLRCENFLVDSGGEKHVSNNCPHKVWYKTIGCCVVCGLKHPRRDQLNLEVAQMFEFVFSALRCSSELRRAARKKFDYRDPGVKLNSWESAGTIKEFLAWMTETSTANSETNFLALFNFIKEEVKVKANVSH